MKLETGKKKISKAVNKKRVKQWLCHLNGTSNAWFLLKQIEPSRITKPYFTAFPFCSLSSHKFIWTACLPLLESICIFWRGTIHLIAWTHHWCETRESIFPPSPLFAPALAQNVLPRLDLIITAANTMAPNGTSRLFEGCRLHHHHNPLHLAHSFPDRRGDKMEKEGGGEGET